jgi:hypothetical protein
MFTFSGNDLESETKMILAGPNALITHTRHSFLITFPPFSIQIFAFSCQYQTARISTTFFSPVSRTTRRFSALFRPSFVTFPLWPGPTQLNSQLFD